MVVLLLVAFMVAGWIVVLPVLLRGLHDLARIPRRAWANLGYERGTRWRVAMIGGYGLGGWPCLVAVVFWRGSGQRADVRREWQSLHARVQSRRGIEPALDLTVEEATEAADLATGFEHHVWRG